MNALILSAGTRNILAEYFMERENGFDKVIATDCSTFAPAIYVVDKYYTVPRMKDPGYLESLVIICKNEKIDVMIPLQEDELLLISKNREIFEALGVLVAISDFEKVALCRDKLSMNAALLEKGIPAVITYKPENYIFKAGESAVVKPRRGAGSVDTMIIRDKSMIDAFVASSDDEMIVQPYLNGKEFGVDLYVDFISKEVISVFVKQKVRMRAGETEKSVSVINSEISELAISAAESIGLVGPIDMDIMESEGKYYILEINPRFGGGYPHAYLCGINFIRMLANNASGRRNTPSINKYQENIKAMKYSDVMLR